MFLIAAVVIGAALLWHAGWLILLLDEFAFGILPEGAYAFYGY